jgi:hypothetical protein
MGSWPDGDDRNGVLRWLWALPMSTTTVSITTPLRTDTSGAPGLHAAVAELSVLHGGGGEDHGPLGWLGTPTTLILALIGGYDV